MELDIIQKSKVYFILLLIIVVIYIFYNNFYINTGCADPKSLNYSKKPDKSTYKTCIYEKKLLTIIPSNKRYMLTINSVFILPLIMYNPNNVAIIIKLIDKPENMELIKISNNISYLSWEINDNFSSTSHSIYLTIEEIRYTINNEVDTEFIDNNKIKLSFNIFVGEVDINEFTTESINTNTDDYIFNIKNDGGLILENDEQSYKIISAPFAISDVINDNFNSNAALGGIIRIPSDELIKLRIPSFNIVYGIVDNKQNIIKSNYITIDVDLVNTISKTHSIHNQPCGDDYNQCDTSKGYICSYSEDDLGNFTPMCKLDYGQVCNENLNSNTPKPFKNQCKHDAICTNLGSSGDSICYKSRHTHETCGNQYDICVYTSLNGTVVPANELCYNPPGTDNIDGRICKNPGVLTDISANQCLDSTTGQISDNCKKSPYNMNDKYCTIDSDCLDENLGCNSKINKCRPRATNDFGAPVHCFKHRVDVAGNSLGPPPNSCALNEYTCTFTPEYITPGEHGTPNRDELEEWEKDNAENYDEPHKAYRCMYLNKKQGSYCNIDEGIVCSKDHNLICLNIDKDGENTKCVSVINSEGLTCDYLNSIVCNPKYALVPTTNNDIYYDHGVGVSYVYYYSEDNGSMVRLNLNEIENNSTGAYDGNDYPKGAICKRAKISGVTNFEFQACSYIYYNDNNKTAWKDISQELLFPFKEQIQENLFYINTNSVWYKNDILNDPVDPDRGGAEDIFPLKNSLYFLYPFKEQNDQIRNNVDGTEIRVAPAIITNRDINTLIQKYGHDTILALGPNCTSSSLAANATVDDWNKELPYQCTVFDAANGEFSRLIPGPMPYYGYNSISTVRPITSIEFQLIKINYDDYKPFEDDILAFDDNNVHFTNTLKRFNNGNYYQKYKTKSDIYAANAPGFIRFGLKRRASAISPDEYLISFKVLIRGADDSSSDSDLDGDFKKYIYVNNYFDAPLYIRGNDKDSAPILTDMRQRIDGELLYKNGMDILDDSGDSGAIESSDGSDEFNGGVYNILVDSGTQTPITWNLTDSFKLNIVESDDKTELVVRFEIYSKTSGKTTTCSIGSLDTSENIQGTTDTNLLKLNTDYNLRDAFFAIDYNTGGNYLNIESIEGYDAHSVLGLYGGKLYKYADENLMPTRFELGNENKPVFLMPGLPFTMGKDKDEDDSGADTRLIQL